MAVDALPIFAYYNRQRFTQFGSGDCANWYGVSAPDTKRGQALYPAMGRQHITSFGQNKLIFNSEPSRLFKSTNYAYVIDGTTVIQVDKYYNEKILGDIPLGSVVWSAALAVNNLVYVMFTTGQRVYVITEDGSTVTMAQVTDPNMPDNPTYIASFGNRFAVSSAGTPNFALTQINLGGVFNPADAFTPATGPLVARASGVIGQMGVLHNQLYIFCTYSTDVWSNTPNQLTVGGVTFEFPWKNNTSYNWDFGIADPESLSIEFDMITLLAQNAGGLVSFMTSSGQRPVDISTQAINVLLQNSRGEPMEMSPFVTGPVYGFTYQYENTIFYRAAAGQYLGYQQLDIETKANAIEYNFSTKTWARVVELNGERNRIQQHTFINGVHLVTVQDDSALYQMAGNIYHNELRTPGTLPQDVNAFTKYPMRYILETQQISLPDYAEFVTNYVQIDFVFGNKTFYNSMANFDSTIFIVHEDSTPTCPIFLVAEYETNNEPVFLVMERGGNPSFSDNHYNALFKPHVELYYSDDGGETHQSADVREFSPLGAYQWMMRWNECGTSRNRTYRVICISSAPIVLLGAVHDTERVSGGAN